MSNDNKSQISDEAVGMGILYVLFAVCGIRQRTGPSFNGAGIWAASGRPW